MMRLATEEDLPAIMDIEHESFNAPRWSEQNYHAMIFRGKARVYPLLGVAEIEGRIAGFVAGHVLSEEECHLESIAVSEAFQRAGIGRAMVRWFLDIAGKVPCLLEVRESNVAALALYQSIGFWPVGRRKNYYTHPTEDALLLQILQ